MARPRVCPSCKKPVIKEDGFEYKGRYYHEQCFSQFSQKTTKERIKEKKERQKIDNVKTNIQKDTHIALETNISDAEIINKEELINYLKQLLKTNRLNAKTYKLLKDYYTIYKFTYEGMLITLKYFYDIQENPVVSDCVGIIPYVYDEAQQYEKIKIKAMEQTKELNLQEIVTQKTVKIKKSQLINNNKLIDIEELR